MGGGEGRRGEEEERKPRVEEGIFCWGFMDWGGGKGEEREGAEGGG